MWTFEEFLSFPKQRIEKILGYWYNGNLCQSLYFYVDAMRAMSED